jgi:hypothetical protein
MTEPKLIPKVVIESVYACYPGHAKQMLLDMRWHHTMGCWMVDHPSKQFRLGIETDGYIHS